MGKTGLRIPFPIPTYEVRRAARPPALDGWLDSACWRGARWVERFISVETGDTSAKPTACALLWDARHLYVGVRCTEPRLACLKIEATQDSEAWNDDSVEIYLDPAVPGVESVDTAVNAAGRACPALRIIADPGWGTYRFQPQDGIRAAVRLTGTGWQVEMAIPFGRNKLPSPRAGDTWRGNLCRNDKLAFQWSYWGLGTTPGYVYSDNKLFPYLRFSARRADAPAKSAKAASAWPRRPRFDLCGIMYDTSRGSLVLSPEYWTGRLPFLRDIGFNTLMMYFENHLRYPSHPEFAPAGAWTLAELARFQEAAAASGIDVIPAQTSIGHCPGILTHPRYQHLAEEGSDGYQFCVAHPETGPMLERIFSDLCAASRSPYVSINADESAYLGLCPRCRRRFRGWSKGAIYRHHILRLYEVIKAHGKRMMMWDDMLWTYPDAVEGLPRDIILLDWHYSLHRRYPSVDVWRAEGFDVVACPGMGLVENAFWLADYGAARGAMGVLNTLWEDHCFAPGARWHHFLATSWAGRAAAPESMDDWYAQAGRFLYGPAGERLGRSIAARDQAARHGQRGGESAVTLLAARQVLDEARALHATLRPGQPRQLLDEFIYATRVTLLHAEKARAEASGGLTMAERRRIEQEAARLRREGLAFWEANCRCPSQKPAFLKRLHALTGG